MEKKLDLRTLVEYEGSGKPLADLLGMGATDLQLLLVVAVREIYRQARQKLRTMGNEAARINGRVMMRTFCDVMAVISDRAAETGEVPLALLARHNRASGYGIIGDTGTQNATNRVILRSIEAGGDDWKDRPDLRFVYFKAFFGLLENDEEFRRDVSLFQWLTSVELLEQDNYPDFAGRATRFVRQVKVEGFPGDLSPLVCAQLLERGTKHEASKDDQRREARELLVEILMQQH